MQSCIITRKENYHTSMPTPKTTKSKKPRHKGVEGNCKVCLKIRVIHRRENDDCLCKSCYDKKRAFYNKLRAIFDKGSFCEICDVTHIHPDLFHFHHRDPNAKEDNISGLLKISLQKAQPEIDKCQLLCVMCHYTKHSSDAIEKMKFINLVANSNTPTNIYISWLPQKVQNEIQQQIINNKKTLRQPSTTKTCTCQYCSEKFERKIYASKPKPKFCSKKCSINNLNHPKSSPKQLKLIME